MERVDIVALALIINVIIFGCYIVYLRVAVKFLTDMLARHHIIIEKMLKNAETQDKINTAQDEYNTSVRELLDVLIHGSSPTGGQKQSN